MHVHMLCSHTVKYDYEFFCSHTPVACVQVFNTDGELLLKFGSNGEGNGQFNAPTGVAVDANGNIIVADWGNSRIQVSRCSVVSYSMTQHMSIRKFSPFLQVFLLSCLILPHLQYCP